MGINLMGESYAFVRTFNKRARADTGRPLEPLEMLVLHRIAFLVNDHDPRPAFSGPEELLLASTGLAGTAADRELLREALSVLQSARGLAVTEWPQHSPDRFVTAGLILGGR